MQVRAEHLERAFDCMHLLIVPLKTFISDDRDTLVGRMPEGINTTTSEVFEERGFDSSPAIARVAPYILLLTLVIVLYGHIGLRLVNDWYTLPDFSHGFLIPLFAAYLLWHQRVVLLGVPSKPSWNGLWVFIAGLLLLLVGVFGADLFLSRVSFILLAMGITWMLCGLAVVRQVRFVFLVLFLGIPLPTLVMNQITFPLQILSSQSASILLPMAGVPVFREGNVIQLASIQLEVAEACSGIRSLLSLFTLSVIYGYFLEKSTWKRVTLALASIPIAVAANAVRIFGTGICVQYWSPDKALGFFHEFSGWLMFLISLTCLYGVHGLLALLSAKEVTVV
jgi:exosortase